MRARARTPLRLRQADWQAPERVRQPATVHLVEAGHRLAEHAHADDAMSARRARLGHLPVWAHRHLAHALAASGEGVGSDLRLHRGEKGLAEQVLLPAL